MPFRSHLPAAFPLFATRPRYTVRHLLRTADVADEPYTFVYEPPAGELGAAGTSYAATPEAAFAPRLAQARLTDLSVTLPLPEPVSGGLLDDPALLAHYIDFRVLVRLSVVENESLLHGTADGAITGLLDQPGIRRATTDQSLEEAVTTAAAHVEETGGSCDGIVAHPFVYWELVRLGALSRLATAGIKVSRTRMIPRDRLLLGDFSAAATLLIPGVADITLDGRMVHATTRVGLAVRLPQHLMTLSWGGDHG
ncbi:hypothetical protein E1294_11425 [Nonomuraea diastatica]|uniref:Uncharacterized protein n=1 Tax=Nonomuraea diastatica TaxID=1848329 RepID=A0A4R4WXY0_9ACTN|nr:hypothetical protein E1294_11425 [Nonomuraea diastatica]